jgi:hypothetical protein
MLQKPFSLELIDLSGRTVLTRYFESLTGDQEIITGGLKGQYIVRITTGKEVLHTRLILGK